MKNLIILLVIGWSTVSNAAGVPIGKFDCSPAKYTFHVTLTSAGAGTYLQVHHVADKEEADLQGYALIALQKFADGSVVNLIKLPGANVELYFDDQGRLGLDRNSLDCRKI